MNACTNIQHTHEQAQNRDKTKIAVGGKLRPSLEWQRLLQTYKFCYKDIL